MICGTGSKITFTDIGGGQCRGYITAPGAGAFTAPSDWNSSDNEIEVIGGGGAGASENVDQGGAGGGGGGGGYSEATNVSYTPRNSITIQVGQGGAAVSGADGGAGTPTFVENNANSGNVVNGNGGSGGIHDGVAGGAGGTEQQETQMLREEQVGLVRTALAEAAEEELQEI